MTDWLAEKLKREGWRVTSVFSHPAFVLSRLKTGKWRLLHHGHQNQANVSYAPSIKARSQNRMTARMEYVGELTPTG
jgi:hypothetical protein